MTWSFDAGPAPLTQTSKPSLRQSCKHKFMQNTGKPTAKKDKKSMFILNMAQRFHSPTIQQMATAGSTISLQSQ